MPTNMGDGEKKLRLTTSDVIKNLSCGIRRKIRSGLRC